MTAFVLAIVLFLTATYFGAGFSLSKVAAKSAVSMNVSAAISGSNVVVTATAGSVPATDDGNLYLYASDVWSADKGSEVARTAAAATATFTFALSNDSADSKLYKKFTVYANVGGTLTAISNSAYITNPEAIADHTANRLSVGKKGLIPDASRISTQAGASELDSMGVHQISYDLRLSQIFNSGGNQISYNYNGKTYNFNQALVNAYDSLMIFFKNHGIQVSVVILNDWQDDVTLIHPNAREAGHVYYALNAAEQAGAEKIAALGSFLASRYCGGSLGQIDNYILGNEVNARDEWNYMSYMTTDAYAVEYANAFRVFYNAVKSENASARVYLPLDQQWAKTNQPTRYHAGKEFLNSFNTYISSQGNIGWDVVTHPYSVEMDKNPTAWSHKASYVSHSQSSWFVTMQNIDVLTDYLCQTSLLKPDGSVRRVLCAEVGYTSSYGEEYQAASFVYGYKQAEANQYIDGFIYRSWLDNEVELSQNLANGLCNVDGSHKMVYDYYVNIDKDSAQSYIDSACSIIGVSDLSSILTVR